MHAEWRDGHKDIGLLPVDHAQSADFAASDQRNMPTTPASSIAAMRAMSKSDRRRTVQYATFLMLIAVDFRAAISEMVHWCAMMRVVLIA